MLLIRVLTAISFRSKKKKRDKQEKRERKRERRDAESSGAQDDVPSLLNGSGRFISSGTTVMGQEQETKFMDELDVGDAVIIRHPSTMAEETRIVKMVLGNSSISIRSAFPDRSMLLPCVGNLLCRCCCSSAFSSDLISGTKFQYIKAPKDAPTEAQVESDRRAVVQKRENLAFGTYAGGGSKGEDITYRVKKPGAAGGYTIVKTVSLFFENGCWVCTLLTRCMSLSSCILLLYAYCYYRKQTRVTHENSCWICAAAKRQIGSAQTHRDHSSAEVCGGDWQGDKTAAT
jgi:hypothetical protein